MDLRNNIVDFAYKTEALCPEMTKKFLDSIMTKNLEKLELCRTLSLPPMENGPFLVGNSATAPDFHLW
jgi:hypothetical protein